MGLFDMFKKKENPTIEKALATMSGMWALWDYEQYKNITSYEEWEKHLLEDADIEKQIDMAKFVPVYIHSDGCYQFRVKVNETLDKRERKYVMKQSEEYLFETNGTAVVSGIDNIDGNVRDDECIKLTLDKGAYSVVIYLIEWDEEPGMVLENGEAAPNALPDFIVNINSIKNTTGTYRTSIETFDEE